MSLSLRCGSIVNLMAGNAANEALFRVDSVRKAHAALRAVAETDGPAKANWDRAAVALRSSK